MVRHTLEILQLLPLWNTVFLKGQLFLYVFIGSILVFIVFLSIIEYKLYNEVIVKLLPPPSPPYLDDLQMQTHKLFLARNRRDIWSLSDSNGGFESTTI